jgi:hypothetical protein
MHPRANQLTQFAHPGDARLSALHAAIFWPRARLGETLERCTAGRCSRISRSAFARSARSGGRTVSPRRLPGVGYQPTRRTPVPLRPWHVSGDALGERDATTIGDGALLSNIRSAINSLAVYSVCTGATFGMDNRDRADGCRRDACAQRVGYEKQRAASNPVSTRDSLHPANSPRPRHRCANSADTADPSLASREVVT